MATLHEITTIKIPYLPSKDGEKFAITCRTLNIFIKSPSEEQAKKDFSTSLELLFKHLHARRRLISFLYSKCLIETHKTFIGGSMNDIEELRNIEEKIQKISTKTIDALNIGHLSEAELTLH
jgi:hypothetical protein